jgi:hypothetical protein
MKNLNSDLIEIEEARTERTGTALFSPCGLYRYNLTRTWDDTLPQVFWIMLNPSTADSIKNDHTISKVVKFSSLAGFGTAIVLNLFAYRTPYPASLFQAHKEGVDIIGPENDKFLQEPTRIGATVVLAWGNHGHFLGRGEEILKWCNKPMILKETKSGQPAHPLMLPYSLELRQRS